VLNINPDIVCSIIERAQEFHAKEGVVIPNVGDDNADWGMQVLADHADDPSFQELKTNIGDLEPDQQITLVALMWLGRGDYTTEEWEEAVLFAQESWNPRTAEYLIGTPLVADYLQEGLSEFSLSCDET